MTDVFRKIDAHPYAWPFDGEWGSQDTALLLLGFQAGTVADLQAEGEAEIAAALAASARNTGVAVVATRRGYREDHAAAATRRHAPGDRIFKLDTPEWQIVPALGLTGSEMVFDHQGDNAFHGTGIEAWLRGKGIRNLLFAGLPTDGLMHASQRAANDMGFECLAIRDACKGTSAARHEGQLRITAFGNGLFGTVAMSEQIISAFSR
jgi:biuret amidohydrolase